MRRLAQWAARLYPAAWRERYGEEFDALLDGLAPGGGDVWDVLRGACIMRMTKLNFGTIALACALAGGLIASVASMARFSGYVSTAVLRVEAAGEETPPQIAMQIAQRQALSRASLSEIMQRPGLNLYTNERRSKPLEDVIEAMRRNIRIQLQGVESGRATIRVSFRYADAAAARRTTAALTERLGGAVAGTAKVEVMEAASPGIAPSASERWPLIRSGLIAGLFAGIACGVLWTAVRGRGHGSVLRLAAFSALGTAAGLVVALRVPDVYVSTAVLRTAGRADQTTLIRTILSEESLGGIIRQEGLYPREVARMPMGDVARRMREQDLRIQPADPGWPAVGAYVITFRDRDRQKAQQATRAIIAAWLAANLTSGTTTVEVIDPASFPGAPSSPNRPNIALAGTAGGLLLGLASSRLRLRAY